MLEIVPRYFQHLLENFTIALRAPVVRLVIFHLFKQSFVKPRKTCIERNVVPGRVEHGQ